MPDDQQVPEFVTGSIDDVLELERRADLERSPVDKVAHAFGEMVGSAAFAGVHIAAFACWLLLNSGIWPRTVFDPYPFALLGTLVSCEAVLLTTFVLVKQNRESDRAAKRAHLDLQINLLTEREVTKVLQIVQRLSDRAGLDAAHDSDLQEMLEETPVKSLASHMRDRHDGVRDET